MNDTVMPNTPQTMYDMYRNCWFLVYDLCRQLGMQPRGMDRLGILNVLDFISNNRDPAERDALKAEVETLKVQARRLKMENERLAKESDDMKECMGISMRIAEDSAARFQAARDELAALKANPWGFRSGPPPNDGGQYAVVVENGNHHLSVFAATGGSPLNDEVVAHAPWPSVPEELKEVK